MRPCAQALHVAVLRRNFAALKLLLERGFPPRAKSEAGWAPLYDAIAMKDERAVLLLHTFGVRDDEAAYRRRKPELAAELAALPDFRCALRWEFCSPVFAPLLRRFAPSDTYVLTKRGTSLRVDGTLKGLSEEASSGGIIPRWERGAFSLLFAAAADADAQAQLLLADHDAAEAVDVLPPGTERSVEDLAAEAKVLLEAGASKGKVKAVEFSFAPLRTWRGEPKREKVQGFDTTVYEAKGRVEGTHRIRTGGFSLRVSGPACAVRKASPTECMPRRSQGTFEEYLANAGAAEEVIPIDLAASESEDGENSSAAGSELGADSGAGALIRAVLCRMFKLTHASPAAGSPAPPTPPRGAARASPQPAAAAATPKTPKVIKPRPFSGRCWMAERHPLSVRALFPLLDVCAAVNKHFGKVRRFLAKWADMDACPVKLQVPIIMTIYAHIAVNDFELLPPSEALPADFFAVPQGYRMFSLEEKMAALEARLGRSRSAEGGAGGDDKDDAADGPAPRRRRGAPASDDGDIAEDEEEEEEQDAQGAM